MTTQTEATQERATLVRTFDVEVVEGDGRTIDAKLVPYGVQARVADHGGPVYTEEFAPGAFKAQETAANRVLMNFEHQPGIGGVVGRGLSLTDGPDGLHGSFRLLDGSDSDKALELVNAGVLRGLSVEFVALKSRTVNGVTQRLRAHLDKVSLCRSPAYADAQIVAVREEPEPAPKPEPAPDDELLERLAGLGVTPIMVRAVTRKPWDGSPARFTDDEYKRSALVCRGTSDSPKTDCSLPVLEPNGDLNLNALSAAAGRLNQADLSSAQKAAAARKLRRYYMQADIEPPPRLMTMAGQ